MTDTEFDLADFDLSARAEAGAPLTLTHPKTGDPLPARIWLQGEDAPSYRQVLHRQIDRQLAERKETLSAAELEARLIERLAALTLRWENINEDGAPVPCQPDRVRRLYRDHLWIREQVTRFVEDRAHFLP